MKPLFQIITASAFVLVGVFLGRGCSSACPSIETRTDTVVIRDTIRDTVLVPIARRIVRVDTVWLRAASDTVRVEVPIEQKTYHTEDYRAVIEGFRPALVSMEVFRQTQHITTTNTVPIPDRRRWSLGLQAGYGITPKGAQPYIGVGVQYSIAKW